MATSKPEIEFWFEFGSNYSYPAVMRIEELVARQYGVEISWQPFLLGPIFQSFGWSNSPFVLQKEKGEYVWRDMARLCEKYGIPWKKPTTFPRLGVLPLRVVLIGQKEPWVGEFARQVMLLNFSADQDINSKEGIAGILDSMGLPTEQIIATAQSEPIKQRLREQTEMAKARKIFGAPTFFVHGEMFWGNDRLEDALNFAVGSESRVSQDGAYS